MKTIKILSFIIAAISIFFLSYYIGRATALKEKAKSINNGLTYNGTVPIPKTFTERKETKDAPTSSSAAKVEKSAKAEQDNPDENESAIEEPVRMYFPCGNTVLKPYSETAIYSETMDDWRAHPGIDYAAKKGSPVYAAWDGIVTGIYKDKNWGQVIEIKHGKAITGMYKSLGSKVFVKVGQAVMRGEKIGTAGKSADVESRETSHLHFELWQDSICINPESYVY